MVLCTDVRNEAGPKIKLTQPSTTTLRCANKLYTIDKDFRSSFHLHNCIMVNPQKDGLYTMFYIADGSCNETWHNRCKMQKKTASAGSSCE